MTIFFWAILPVAGSSAYDEDIRRLGREGRSPGEIFEALAVVQIDSGSGDVTSVKVQSAEETREAKREAAARDQDDLVLEKLRELGGGDQQ